MTYAVAHAKLALGNNMPALAQASLRRSTLRGQRLRCTHVLSLEVELKKQQVRVYHHCEMGFPSIQNWISLYIGGQSGS